MGMMKYLLLEEMQFSLLFGSLYFLWKSNQIHENNQDFFSCLVYPSDRVKDEQKEVCFVSLQDFKKKTLKLVLPVASNMASAAVKNGEEKSYSFEMLNNYLFIFLAIMKQNIGLELIVTERYFFMPEIKVHHFSMVDIREQGIFVDKKNWVMRFMGHSSLRLL